jgi:RNA polymerase sigma-70 factor (ECF subfamily)
MANAGDDHGGPPRIADLDVTEVLALLRAGDEQAAHVIYERWAGRLIGLARARLGGSIAGKEDPEDVVQSVYRSFFRRDAEAPYQFGDWQDVWALLATIARRKCVNRRLHYSSERRATSRESRPDAIDAGSAEPPPEEVAMLAETVQSLLLRFPARERAVVELSLQGYTVKEISAQLGRAERSVFRVREHVRVWLQTHSC